MKRMINGVVLAVFVTAGAAYAVPVVSNVKMAQRPNSRTVDITYDLAGEAAIVTLGIETNGVAIPDSAVTWLSGDVSTVIQPATGKSIVWDAGTDWPENLTQVAKAKVTAWSTNVPPQVMVIDLTKGSAATEINPYPVRYYTSLDALPGGGLSNNIYKTDTLVMRKIPKGIFAMGDESTGGTSVLVTLTNDFYIGVYQMTQRQWSKVMGTDPSERKDPGNPVEKVSYYDIREKPGNQAMEVTWPESDAVHPDSFMGVLHKKTGLAGFDLPTDAQWEYACRAGNNTYYNDGISGTSTNQLNELAWWKGNSGLLTHQVGQKKPNAWGLYDMHGNVREWCLDWHKPSLDGGIDPKGPETGAPTYRVYRGGSWNDLGYACRSEFRNGYLPSFQNLNYGFRLVRTLP